jgi:hypothetical protein
MMPRAIMKTSCGKPNRRSSSRDTTASYQPPIRRADADERADHGGDEGDDHCDEQ